MKIYNNITFLSLLVCLLILSDVYGKKLDKYFNNNSNSNIEFTTDVGVRFLKRISDVILNKGNNYVDETKFNTNMNYCIKSFETNEVPALKTIL